MVMIQIMKMCGGNDLDECCDNECVCGNDLDNENVWW